MSTSRRRPSLPPEPGADARPQPVAGIAAAKLILEGLPQPQPIEGAPRVVAFSGGLDSTVLLHTLRSQSQVPLRAVHIHHGLQAAADDWARHCSEVCAALGIELRVVHVSIDPDDHAGPEAAARNARYAALRSALDPGECLVTAHHRDDQAETLLLRLLRGSGAEGLAGMRELVSFAPGWLWRPLLDLPRTALREYALAHGLRWIDDPQNADPRYTRSWLRANIVPLLRERFPQMDRSLARAARLLAESTDLVEELAAQDFAAASNQSGLSISAASVHGRTRRNNLLRYWLRTGGFLSPDAAMLERLWQEVALAQDDAEPCVKWASCEVRRYRNRLHAMPPLPPPPRKRVIEWHGSNAIELPPGCGRLLANTPPSQALKIRFAQGGERFQPAIGTQSRTLKNIFQEAAVPPWIRIRTPLIELDGSLAFVGNIGGSADWQTFCATQAWTPRWQSPFGAAAL